MSKCCDYLSNWAKQEAVLQLQTSKFLKTNEEEIISVIPWGPFNFLLKSPHGNWSGLYNIW